MFDTLTVSNEYRQHTNIMVLSDSLLKALNLSKDTKLSIIKHENVAIELVPITDYAKGDIRRLKGLVKTHIKASIDDMNEGITMGAIHGE